MKASIRTKLTRSFLILLGALLLLCSAFSFAGMRLIRRAARLSEEQLGTLASQSSREMMLDQMLDAAGSFVAEKALTISQQLDNYVRASAEMAAYVAYLYENPARFPALAVPTPDELVRSGSQMNPALHYLPATEAIQGPAAQAENELLGNLEGVFAAVYANNPEISSIYTAHETGANIGYDENYALKTEIASFDCRGLDWYVCVKDTADLYVSKTYADSFGRGLTVTLAQPIQVQGTFQGVLGIDLLIESINREILNTRFGAGGYAMLFDKDGDAIAARNGAGHPLGSAAEAVLAQMRNKERGIAPSVIADENVYILYAPVPAVSWKLAVVMPEAEMMQPAAEADRAIQAISARALQDMDRIIGRLNLLMLAIFLLLAAAAVIIIRRVCDRIAQPVLALAREAETVGEGNLDYRSNIRTGDELELLGERFESMTASLRTYIDNLTRVTAERERLDAELSIATKIQTSMLPCIFPPFPDRPEFDIYATMQPAKEVGGDFYDFALVDEDHLMLVIADVSGKGIPAALFMMTTKTLIRSAAQAGRSPAEVLAETNARLCENNAADMFVTAWIGVLEISTGRFVYANAGHNAPLIKRQGESFQLVKIRPGFVLAGLPGVRYPQAETTLQPGDMLYLYTDGVTEAGNPQEELYGEDRLQQALNQSGTSDLKAILSNVKQSIDAFAEGTAQFDDITMLILRVDERGVAQ